MTTEKSQPLVEVVILRPRHQAAPLMQALTEIGYQAVSLPLLVVKPIVFSDQMLQTAKNALSASDLVIVTSANVIDNLPSICHEQLAPKTIVTMGESTSRSLETFGLSPYFTANPGTTSETLLNTAMLQPEKIKGKNVVILGAKNGRMVLPTQLKNSGANVVCVDCYETIKPEMDLAPQMQAWQKATSQQLFVATSSKALQHLVEMTPKTSHQWLSSQPILVVSQRIKDDALQLGFDEILVSTSPHVTAVCATIQQWQKSR